MNITRALILILAVNLILGSSYAGQSNGKKKADGIPPGLSKRLERGKPLPPGWQKKLAKGDVLDDSLYARGTIVVPLGQDGTLSIKIEGTIFRLNHLTRAIIAIQD